MTQASRGPARAAGGVLGELMITSGALVWVRLLLALLALAAVVVCFTWLFPQLAPLLPLNDPEVRG